MWCPRVSECWRGVRPRSPGCDQAGAHRVFLTSGTQLLPDLWRVRWNTMVTSISTDNNSDNSEYLQILFLALLLSSCHGQEYPAKVDLVISSLVKRLIQSVRQLDSLQSCMSEFILGLFNCNSCWWCMDYVSSHFHLRRRMCVLMNGHEREVWRKHFWDKVQRETISLEWGRQLMPWILWLEHLCLNFDDVQTEIELISLS